jgi:cbb3-type cytochrome oxidase maturation protein
MIDFFFLVPMAIGMGLVGLASFMWTLRNGQYDDLEGAAQRILFEGNEGPMLEKHPTPSAAIQAGPQDRNPPKDKLNS